MLRESQGGWCRKRWFPLDHRPARVRDPHPCYPDTAVAGQHSLSLRAREASLDQLGEDRGADALRKHQRLGAALRVIDEMR